VDRAVRSVRQSADSVVLRQPDRALGHAEGVKETLTTLQELMAAGKVTPVINSRQTLAEVPAAIRYL
jgi:hypothetical protein